MLHATSSSSLTSDPFLYDQFLLASERGCSSGSGCKAKLAKFPEKKGGIHSTGAWSKRKCVVLIIISFEIAVNMSIYIVNDNHYLISQNQLAYLLIKTGFYKTRSVCNLLLQSRIKESVCTKCKDQLEVYIEKFSIKD